MSQSKLELTEEGRKNGLDRDTLLLLNSQKGMKWHTNRVIDKVEGINMVSMGSGSPSLNLVALLFITKTLTHPLSVFPIFVDWLYLILWLSLLPYSHLNVIKLALVCCILLHGHSYIVCRQTFQ